MSRVACLLVTCCLERSRSELLAQVITNLQQQAPELHETLTVFDNASTEPDVIDVLRDCYTHVYQCDRNVGYWTAIDWWLQQLKDDPPAYTYIIESDMMHYRFSGLYDAVEFLDLNPGIGSVRLHEYSIENWRYYNKDAPIPGSRSNLWQSHTNKVTGESVGHSLVDAQRGIWKTNFLTQLPALNRYQDMAWCFDQLAAQERFTELDFQRLYHSRHPVIAILDGGVFNCDLNPYGTTGVTGSWTSAEELKRLGYQSTRFASIVPRGQYNVRRM
jgi:hypothetical protein